MSRNQADLVTVKPGSATRSFFNPGQFKAKAGRWLTGALLPVAVLVIWQILGDLEYISFLLFPTPLRILSAFTRLYESGELYDNLKISILRAAGGFLLGGGLGLLFGALVGLFRNAERTLDPTFQMVRMVPHLAVTSLFILWFGIGETAKVLMIAKGAFFPLYINTFLGIRGADNKLYEVARVLGFNRWKQLTRLVLPAAMPNIFLGIRLSVGISWLGLVVAELMGSTSGIGYLMMDARASSKTAVVFVGIFIFAVFGKSTDSLIRYIERRTLRWRDSFQG